MSRADELRVTLRSPINAKVKLIESRQLEA